MVYYTAILKKTVCTDTEKNFSKLLIYIKWKSKTHNRNEHSMLQMWENKTSISFCLYVHKQTIEGHIRKSNKNNYNGGVMGGGNLTERR